MVNRRTAGLGLLILLSGVSVFGETYTVQKGDTFYSIAKKYGMTQQALAELNHVTDPSKLGIGTVLTVKAAGSPETPSFSLYTVVPGDNLYRISVNHGVSLRSLLELNGLNESSVIGVGQRLKIPGKKGAMPPVTEPDPRKPKPRPTVVVAGKDQTGSLDPVDSSKDPSGPESGGIWPLDGKRRPRSGKFSGVEILGSKGDLIRSVSSGRVVYADEYRNFGLLVMVETEPQLVYFYGGKIASRVHVGQEIDAGDVLCTLEGDEESDESLVVFSVYHKGKAISPEKAPHS